MPTTIRIRAPIELESQYSAGKGILPRFFDFLSEPDVAVVAVLCLMALVIAVFLTLFVPMPEQIAASFAQLS